MPLKDHLQKTKVKAKKIHQNMKRVRISSVAKIKQLPNLKQEAKSQRELRRTPTGYSFVIADHIQGLRPDHWDELTSGKTACLSRTFLHALQQAGPEGIHGHYVLIYQNERPVVAMACQSLYINAEALPAAQEIDSTLDELRGKSLRRLKQRILVCGNLLGWGQHGVAFAEGVDKTSLWTAVAEALYRIRRADKLFGETGLIMIKDLAEEFDAAKESLTPFRYKSFATEPNMVLQLNPAWKNFDDYLAAMKSDYRSSIKKQIKEIAAAELVVETLNSAQIEERKQDIYQLYMNVHARQKMRLVTISPDWIPTLARGFNEQFRCTVIRRPSDNHLCGFITTFRDADGAIAYYIGFDKNISEQGIPLYLRLLYASISDAIELRANWVSMGRTALEPKASLGAQPQPMHCLLRHRFPAVNIVVSALLQAIPDPAQPPVRTPFKANKTT